MFIEGGPLAHRSIEIGKTTPAEVVDAVYEQIVWYDEQGRDVPKEMYDFYYAFDHLVNPQFYAEQDGRVEGNGALDELVDTCPGTLILGPGHNVFQVTTNCGQTYTAVNNCSFPDCRYGRDVVVELWIYGFDYIKITTTGSTFDTYLCLYGYACCGQEGSDRIAANNNAPWLCNGQRLAAGIEACLTEGVYHIVLDGASPAAFGSYCLTIAIDGDNCPD